MASSTEPIYLGRASQNLARRSIDADQSDANSQARHSDGVQASRCTGFLRLRHVVQVTGLSRMTIYRLEQAGRFPTRRRISANSVAWLEEDVAKWIGSRPIVASSKRNAGLAR